MTILVGHLADQAAVGLFVEQDKFYFDLEYDTNVNGIKAWIVNSNASYSLFNGLLPKPYSCASAVFLYKNRLDNYLIILIADSAKITTCGVIMIWATARQALTPFLHGKF